MKSNKNSGIAKMELIIAAVILAVVVIGVLIAIKLVSGGTSEENNQSAAEKTATSIYTKINSFVSEANLTIYYKASLNTLYIVSTDKYQVIHYDQGNLYLKEGTYSDMSLAYRSKIDLAKRSAASSSDELMAAGITTFIVTVPEEITDGSHVILEIRVGEEYKKWTISLNKDMVYYAQNGKLPDNAADTGSVSTDSGNDATPTPTPTPTTKPTNTPTPTPEAAPDIASMTRTTLRNNGNGPFNVADLKDYVDGGYVIITATRNSVKDSVVAGWGIGGLGFSTDDWAIEAGTKFEVTVDESMLVAEGETIEVVYTAKEIYDYAVDKGTDEVIVNFYNGYVTTSVEAAK